MELSSWRLRQRGYRHGIPDAAPSHALSGAHIPIVVIRESGLTIIELELELEAFDDQSAHKMLSYRRETAQQGAL